MALNGLAGAGQTKRTLLESKGIFEERLTGDMQLLGGIFNRKKSGSGTSTPNPAPKRQPTTETMAPSGKAAEAEKDKAVEAANGAGGRKEEGAKQIKAAG